MKLAIRIGITFIVALLVLYFAHLVWGAEQNFEPKNKRSITVNTLATDKNMFIDTSSHFPPPPTNSDHWSTPTEVYNALVFLADNQIEILRFEIKTGDIFWRNRLVTTDKELVASFVDVVMGRAK